MPEFDPVKWVFDHEDLSVKEIEDAYLALSKEDQDAVWAYLESQEGQQRHDTIIPVIRNIRG